MNNGLNKGGSRDTFRLLHSLEGAVDTWQIHRSADAGDENFSARTDRKS